MLALDFINIGNGDCILIREMEGTQQKFALMVDFGHDCLVRDDHPGELDPRSQRIYAGDFLRELGVTHLDVALATHFHRDHIGGLSRVLDAVTIDRFYSSSLRRAEKQTRRRSSACFLMRRHRKRLRRFSMQESMRSSQKKTGRRH